MTSDTSLICFKAISNFTSELVELFSKQQRSLRLYGRLINKTTFAHDDSIKKHIDAFRTFCITNRDAIIQKSVEKITMNKISYSQRVFIDMIDIFKISDKDTSKVIWEHLLCISAMVDPAGKAREILKEKLASNMSSSLGESSFLTDFISKVEDTIDPNANPMEAISSIMKSGVFTELVGGMNSGLSDGSLDLPKLMGSIQGMLGQLGEKSGGNPQTDGIMNMMTSMLGSSGKDGTPDLAGMMKGLMGGLNKPNENGSINPPDLAGMMKGLMGGLNNHNPTENGNTPDLAGMMKGLMGGLNNHSENGNHPDLAGIMNEEIADINTTPVETPPKLTI
jgi:hypothetical protein